LEIRIKERGREKGEGRREKGEGTAPEVRNICRKKS